MKTKEELIPILKKVTIFSGLKNSDIEFLCSQCSIVDKKDNDELIEEGTEATEIFILISGKVKIILNKDKDPLELVELCAGSCFGEASVIGIQKHSASAIAHGDCEIFILSRKVLMEIYADNKDLFSLLILNIARELARRLSRTDQTLLHYKDFYTHHQEEEKNRI